MTNKKQYKVQFQWATGKGSQHFVYAQEGANLLDVLREHQLPVEAPCNGNGQCGKCKVRLIQGDVPVSVDQRLVFTEQELAEGYRLACQVKVTQDMTVSIQIPDNQVQIQTALCHDFESVRKEALEYAIAVDLGSTTLAAVMTDVSGAVLAQASAANSQRNYGADVISRMQASNNGNRHRLQECICKDLEQLFMTLIHQTGEQVKISRIAIAGNTVMLHMLRGYSCEKLGVYPFEPVSLKLESLPYEVLFQEISACSGSTVYLLPGLSAFVGADITAGLYSSGFWKHKDHDPAFFIDLGTNGELALGTQEGYITASTAAGPAFEGGGLSCGIPGIAGAIAQVSYLYHRVRVRTIGQKKPCGICGSGALEATAALLKEGLLDTEGLLVPELFEKGLLLAYREDGSGIYLTQADIRKIQMAKAAIRAGIEVLQEKYQETTGIEFVNRIYLAGGFGYYLSAETAIAVGLFPLEWKERIVVCGNTSLKGAIAFLSDVSCADAFEQICSKNQSIRLESNPRFQELYVNHMRFPEAYIT